MTFEPLTPERRREMTRRHLLDAAAIVFARDGFHGATLDDVAATAGFTKGAVYSNFKSKDDLFLAVLRRPDRAPGGRDPRGARGTGARRRDWWSNSRVRSIIERMWDDEWTALHLEFVLYATRNPAAREKLAASARREREVVIDILQRRSNGSARSPSTRYPHWPSSRWHCSKAWAWAASSIRRRSRRSCVTEVLTFLYETISVDLPPT